MQFTIPKCFGKTGFLEMVQQEDQVPLIYGLDLENLASVDGNALMENLNLSLLEIISSLIILFRPKLRIKTAIQARILRK